MPLSAVHYAFESQAELLDAVVNEVTDAERYTAEISVEGAKTPREAIVMAMRSYLTSLERDPMEELTLLELGVYSFRQHPDSRMRAQWRTYYDTAESMLRTIAEQTRCQWSIPVEELGHYLTVLLDGLTTTWLADGDNEAALGSIEFSADALVRYASPID